MKRCCTCKKYKKEEYFNKNSSIKDKLSADCKKCHAKCAHKHYLNHKKSYREAKKKFMENLKKWFIDYKLTCSCELCGETKYWRLAFHHKNPKKKDNSITNMVYSQNCSPTKIMKEIKKCTVVCHNCHSDIHHEERQ